MIYRGFGARNEIIIYCHVGFAIAPYPHSQHTQIDAGRARGALSNEGQAAIPLEAYMQRVEA